ncbi:MAG: chemotaxis protein CheA [Candidatus Riflebacteria bacterium]|nr:chemotaxis protein CheA [Candidatus Riflebacteria bacterium]
MMDIDLSQYMGMYVDGSRENLDLMDKHLLALEQDTDNIEAVGEIFRAAHTLKGMSATMGFEKVAHLTHEMENVLDKFRNHTVAVTPEIIDILFETFDCLRTLVNDSIDSTDSNVDLEGISAKLAECVSGNSSEKTSPKPVSAPSVSANKAFDSGIDYSKELAEFPINEFEYQVLVEASQRNWHIFLLTVTLVQDCLLKAPRAFMVTRTLDEFSCEILKSSPETKDIEEEKFDLSFKLLVVGEVVLDNLKKAIEEISEIDSVKVLKLKPEDFLHLSGEKPAVAVERRPYAQTEPTKVVSAPNTAFQNEAVAANRVRPAVEQKASTESLTTGAAPAPAAPSAKTPAAKASSSERRASQTVRVDMHRLDELMNLVGELVINRTRLSDIGATHKLKDLNETLTRVSQISSSLQSVVMQVRMVPIEQVFDRFPRMVRDLAKKLNKKINLVLEGKETEMDRTVIDEIGDPMVHLIRNSIDHGIEKPEERISKGKPEVGTITLSARHEGNNVLIEVKDDGKGVDPSVVGRLAVERGLFSQENLSKMPPEEIQKVIFLPGFSTAKEVSDLSGRGVGMDAVKAKLEDLNGVLDLESRVNEGSKVTIKLPLTLAILPALMVKIGAEMFAVPLGSVDETLDISKSDINIVQHQEVTLLRGDVLPIIRLRNILDVPTTPEEAKEIEEKTEEISIVVCSSGEKRAGFMVDELLGQQEIVIKSLGNLLGGLPGIMGATMRGDGSIALILDVPSFFQKGQGL